MPLLVLSPKILNFITKISPILKSLHWLKITERINSSHIKLLTLVILHIFILFLILNAIFLHARLLWSHLIVFIINHVSKSLIDLFILLLLLYGTVFLLHDLRHFSSHSIYLFIYLFIYYRNRTRSTTDNI